MSAFGHTQEPRPTTECENMKTSKRKTVKPATKANAAPKTTKASAVKTRTGQAGGVKTRKSSPIRPLNKAWFTDQFAAKRISQRQLAFQIGMDPAALSMTLSGQRKLQIPEAEAIAAQLGVPAVEVLRHAGLDTSAGAIQDALVVGWVGINGEVNEGRLEGPRRVATPTDMPDGTQVLRFQGEPATDGWLCFYQPRNHVPPDCLGRLCVVKVQGGAHYVARMLRGYAAGVWNLGALAGPGLIMEGARVLSASPIHWIKVA